MTYINQLHFPSIYSANKPQLDACAADFSDNYIHKPKSELTMAAGTSLQDGRPT